VPPASKQERGWAGERAGAAGKQAKAWLGGGVGRRRRQASKSVVGWESGPAPPATKRGVGWGARTGAATPMEKMASVDFYHLTRSALEPALGRLLEKVLASGQRAVVLASSAERVEALDRALWTIGRDSFLPHGSRADGFAEHQPVFLTHEADYPNGATVLVLVDGAEVEPEAAFQRCLVMFDGGDEAAVGQARDLWRRWRDGGKALTYWQQTERGWTKAADV
jgi:DNA polymerase-3 subunit chi